jgi:hypothetical protein
MAAPTYSRSIPARARRRSVSSTCAKASNEPRQWPTSTTRASPSRRRAPAKAASRACFTPMTAAPMVTPFVAIQSRVGRFCRDVRAASSRGKPPHACNVSSTRQLRARPSSSRAQRSMHDDSTAYVVLSKPHAVSDREEHLLTKFRLRVTVVRAAMQPTPPESASNPDKVETLPASEVVTEPAKPASATWDSEALTAVHTRRPVFARPPRLPSL